MRPQVAIDPTYNGGVGAAIVVMNDVDAVNGSVYYKAAPLTGAGALTFTTAGKGTAFIGSSTDNDVEDPTTTKQLITQASGLLVEAADRTSLFYLHNVLPLSDTVDTTGPVGTIAINNNPTPDSTKLTAVTLTISATDPNGVRLDAHRQLGRRHDVPDQWLAGPAQRCRGHHLPVRHQPGMDPPAG